MLLEDIAVKIVFDTIFNGDNGNFLTEICKIWIIGYNLEWKCSNFKVIIDGYLSVYLNIFNFANF